MHGNRKHALLGLLAQRGRVTAAELSRHFGVTTRTIYRDVERLAQDGIPVYMTKGKGGGVQLAQNTHEAARRCSTGMVAVRLYVRPAAAERARDELIGWYQQEDGSLLCDCDLPDNEQTLHWLLSYGSDCVVLEPRALRHRLVNRLRDMVEYYI